MFGIDSSSAKTWLKIVALTITALVAFGSRLFSVIRFESIIHEFDPWFNYRTTKHLVETDFYEFLNWFDDRSWYPLGRVVGGTVYPGIMVTSALIHYVLNYILHFTILIRDVCVFLAPIFSGLTALATYFFTKEMKNESAGLLSAIFIGIIPGYISRSVAGSYDNEGIAIFLLMFTYFLWIKALKQGSAVYAVLTALFYYYMVSAWGGYVFIINLIPLHVFVLILMGRFSNRLYVSYCTFYVIGTLASMTIPFVGFQPTRTSEHMAALGIFGLCQLMAFSHVIRGYVSSKEFKTLLQVLVVLIAGVLFTGLVVLTLGGVIAPWTGRFYSLWDTGYAKKYIPIIASVSEHQPTAWTSFFFDLQYALILFPAGIFYCFVNLKDEHIFIILYGITASYFAGVMVRLMLTLTPVVCVASAMALSNLLGVYGKSDDVKEPEATAETAAVPTESPTSPNMDSNNKKKKKGNSAPTTPTASSSNEAATKKQKGFLPSFESKIYVYAINFYLLSVFVYHCTYVTSSAYSSPSVILASHNRDGSMNIIDDFREAYYWLRKNSDPDAKIMSWWDYGYQIAGFSDRTTLVDNNTWNNTHIATVGKAMSSGEEVSYEIMRQHDVDYVLVIFGAVIGYSGDDINKFLWMIRIAQGVYSDAVKESAFFTRTGEYRVDEQATPAMKNSLMYKMSYHKYSEIFGGNPYDRVRNVAMPKVDPSLSVLEEAFSSENFIVRIFKVKPLDNIGRTLKAATSFENQYASRAVTI